MKAIGPDQPSPKLADVFQALLPGNSDLLGLHKDCDVCISKLLR